MEFYRFQVLEQKLYNEMNVNEADELLIDWERSVGLPDACITTNVDKERRRQQVYQKFSKYGGVQKKEDFVRVGAFFGFDLTIVSGKTAGAFPLTFPIIFFSGIKESSHTLFIQIDNDLTDQSSQFPLIFPIPFSKGGKVFLQCIFDQLAPANVRVIIINKGEI
jgi:hypothetical protein